MDQGDHIDEFIGFGVSGYRSFWDDIQQIGPMKKIHLVIGQNDSGKSNVLEFVHRNFPADHGGLILPPSLEGLDRPHGRQAPLQFSIARPLDYLPGVEAYNKFPLAARRLAERFIQQYSDAQQTAWLHFVEQPGDDTLQPSRAQAEAAISSADLDSEEVIALASAIAGQPTRPEIRHFQELARQFARLDRLPQVRKINAYRQIRDANSSTTDETLSGVNLVTALAQLQGPDHENLADRARFDRILGFVRNVLGDNYAEISIPASQREILVRSREQTLPLKNHGTGIHQVIVLAAAATVVEHSLVCIEEPEVFLHPTLQRRLIRYLSTDTSNRYLIATHSAHILDSNICSVTHVKMSDKGSLTTPAIEPRELATITSDLGYRASDLLQTNMIVWVEGPSDRVYLSHWIKLVDPALIEGVHYSIMFYGGSLLREVSAEDVNLTMFISLPRLNRNMAIIIDSDMMSATQILNDTKTRVVSEFESQSAIAWVTDGYTIENYVPEELLGRAVRDVHPQSNYQWSWHRHENPLSPSTSQRSSTFDKVQIARRVVESWHATSQRAEIEPFSRVTEIVSRIRTANDLIL